MQESNRNALKLSFLYRMVENLLIVSNPFKAKELLKIITQCGHTVFDYSIWLIHLPFVHIYYQILLKWSPCGWHRIL